LFRLAVIGGAFSALCASQVMAQTYTLLMPVTQNWRYSTNNLDGTGWQAKDHVETGWSNLSPALLHIDEMPLPAP